MTIGQRILQLRISCGLSQEEFGARLGTSRQTVSKWELDITLPEVEKIVKISRLFGVTTDSILVEGISTFDENYERVPCGIYRSERLELVETERVALVYYAAPDRAVFGVKAYVGFDHKKALRAVCEYRTEGRETRYAYTTDAGACYANDDTLRGALGEAYDADMTKKLYRSETFYIARDPRLPGVEEAGIKACLAQWRMSTTLRATAARFSLFICTDRTEYAFDIAPQDDNVYCAISLNRVTELGLLAGKQSFRIRNYKDNTEPFCGAFCELGQLSASSPVPTAECVGNTCVQTGEGLFFGVKRYTNDEIVLCGCGGDEYRYTRTEPKLERLLLEPEP